MNTSTLIGRPLLLVAVLAVSWAAAVPLQPLSGTTDLEEDPETFLENNPSVARELYLHLLEEEETESEEEPYRRKRDTNLSGGFNAKVTPHGHSLGGSGTLTHGLSDKFAVSGTAGGNRDTIRGLGNIDTYSAGAGLHYSPNSNTAFSIGKNKQFLPGGGTTSGTSLTLEKKWDNNKHSVSGTFASNKHNIPGAGSFKTSSGSANYNYNINKDLKFNVGGGVNRTPFGSEGFLGSGLSLSFGG